MKMLSCSKGTDMEIIFLNNPTKPLLEQIFVGTALNDAL